MNRDLRTVFDHVRYLGHDEDFHSAPGEPIQAPPGSKEKVELMAQRVLAGESIFNPQDGTCDDLEMDEIAQYKIRACSDRLRASKVPMSFANPCRVNRKSI